MSEYPSLLNLLCAGICVGALIADTILVRRWREAATMLVKAEKTHRTAREMMRIANERMNKAMRLTQGRDDMEEQA